MNKLKLHTVETAPEGSKAILEQSMKSLGRIPNLYAVMAESPGLLEAYPMLNGLFQNSSFNKDEITVVWQTINVEHECHYCVAGHTGIANMMKVDPSITEALRNETPLANEKLEILRNTTLSIVRNRGRINPDELEKFFNAGYTNRNLLDIILGLSQKIISNYVSDISETELDRGMEKYEWHKKTK